MNRKFMFCLIGLIIICYLGCGSTVTEPTGNNQDATIQDIVLSDITKDTTTKDSEPSDITHQDTTIPDVDEGDIIVNLDVEFGDSEPSDSGIYLDISLDSTIKDIVDEDATNNDVGADTGAPDTGVQYCKVGEERYYTCPNGTQVTECVCEYKGCMPKCDKIGTKSEGWYDCDGNLIRFATCKDCKV
ncbi:MAG: hypothetical protein N2746_09130, partial [Deltaproteobacteria bacterium]|nr:hypothetical protein [Deltaproteobacteria bacterium]